MSRLLLLLLVAGCAASDGGAAPAPEHSRVDASAPAPTPYTAAEIREACTGARRIHRVERAGGEALVRTTVFLASDDPDVAVFETRTTTAAGEPLGDPVRSEASWEELRAHAAFPAEATQRREEEVETPAGRFRCWLYTVRETTPAGEMLRRFWFAHDLPGPPVRMDVETDGTLATRMILIEHGRAPAGG